jgi:Protein of unknown function (DUF4031)
MNARLSLMQDAAGGADVTVYVYKLAGQQGKFWTQGFPFPWYGLTADTEEELHPFAESIGLYRHFYRPTLSGDKQLPMTGHYDVDEGERDRAVENGARPITTRERKKMLDKRAAELGITLK